MKLRELLTGIEGVFIPPKERYYFGKLHYGTPYFDPMFFNKNIISLRKLRLRTPEEIQAYDTTYPFRVKSKDYDYDRMLDGIPMCRRSKDTIIKLFGLYFWIQIGWPIMIKSVELGWKDKWNSPRYEWCPSFQIYFFHWQFCIHWKAPDDNDNLYYEMILWYLEYSKSNIKTAEKTWIWKEIETNKSTWNNQYLINK